MAAAFTLTDVSLHYSEKQLLSHISITISEGDKIGVVGRNGACLLYTSDAADE